MSVLPLKLTLVQWGLLGMLYSENYILYGNGKILSHYYMQNVNNESCEFGVEPVTIINMLQAHGLIALNKDRYDLTLKGRNVITGLISCEVYSESENTNLAHSLYSSGYRGPQPRA